MKFLFYKFNTTEKYFNFLTVKFFHNNSKLQTN